MSVYLVISNKIPCFNGLKVIFILYGGLFYTVHFAVFVVYGKVHNYGVPKEFYLYSKITNTNKDIAYTSTHRDYLIQCTNDCLINGYIQESNQRFHCF